MKLSIEDVQHIKWLIKEGKLTRAEIARSWNIGRSTIVDMAFGKTHKSIEAVKPIRGTSYKPTKSRGNVLIIGDLHQPFTLDGYLSFCKEQYDKFKCKQIIFIGDIIDNHYASYHETDPDGLSGGDELDLSIEKVKPWVKMFPKAYVTIGNHDRMVMRKAFSGGIPKLWIKSYSEVLGASKWKFVDEIVIDDVQYIHGEGGTARTKARNDKFSTVQGHLHTHSYVESLVGRDSCIFGMQVGCGIDRRAYAMAYASTGAKPAIGCGVVLEKGKLPIQIMADLSEDRFVFEENLE